jgi:hypothetical protein
MDNGSSETLRFTVPDEHLKAAIYVLGGTDPKPNHRDGWKILVTEADRRRNKLPPTEVCMPRHVFETLPIAIQGLLSGE